MVGGIDRPERVALAIALVLLVLTSAHHGGVKLAAAAAVGVVLVLATRWRVATLAIAVLLVVGIALRAAIPTHLGSDVLDVTAAAIRQVTNGQNPYGIGYAASRPPGAPYPYGPLALLWYAIDLDHPSQIDATMACVVLALLALRGKLLGLAIYAVGPTLAGISVNGSNDTSAGVLLLGALVIARRRPFLGAVVLAAAVAFKPYAAAWVPAFLLWGGWTVAGAFAVASVVLWAPVLLVWGIPSVVNSFDMANRVHRHANGSFGRLWEIVFRDKVSQGLLDNLRLVLGSVTAVVTLRWVRTLDGVILAGTLVYLVTLYMGYWATFAYVSAIAPILCWRIDDWLHLPTRPLVDLPGNEVVRGVAA
jgi:hypothetical protein